jgi:outer membrane protein OmpA-like peptidoglycan-associated protein
MRKGLLFSLLILVFIGNSFSQFKIQNCKKSPIYKDNGGYKKTNILNKAKVKKEAAAIEICNLLDKIDVLIKQNIKTEYINKEKDAIYSAKEAAILKTRSDLVEIAKKLEDNKLSSVKDFETVLEILKEIRNLKCRQIDAITLLDKRINRIYGDISFRTGSSDISSNGINEISVIIKELISDISDWKSYVNECNERTFENDLFVLVVDIDGYADQQGSSSSNLILSQKRAEAVKLELIRQLNALVVSGKVSIVFDKIQARGFGETLPPGTIDAGLNDPKRRICIINSLVGPSQILK